MNDFDISENGISLGLTWDILFLVGLAAFFIMFLALRARAHRHYFKATSLRIFFNQNYVLVTVASGVVCLGSGPIN